jgi:hypothetical protein
MPHSELHSRKRNQNIAVLLAIMGFCGLVLAVTLVKMSGG